MKQIINYNALTITHTHKPKQKHTYISIENDGSVSIRTPIKDVDALIEIIQKKEQWIRAQLYCVNQKLLITLGKELLFLGEKYTIESEPASKLRTLIKRLKVQTPETIQKCYNNFYKKESEIYIPKRVEYFSKVMKLYPQSIVFRKMKRRWGSCDSHKKLTFNSAIMKLTREQIDYIIVHELAHIKHMNHSHAFHQLIENYLEDAKEIERALRKLQP